MCAYPAKSLWLISTPLSNNALQSSNLPLCTATLKSSSSCSASESCCRRIFLSPCSSSIFRNCLLNLSSLSGSFRKFVIIWSIWYIEIYFLDLILSHRSANISCSGALMKGTSANFTLRCKSWISFFFDSKLMDSTSFNLLLSNRSLFDISRFRMCDDS